jgi:hypothetical protein
VSCFEVVSRPFGERRANPSQAFRFCADCVRISRSFPPRSTPIAPLTQLVVRNSGYFDVNVAVIASPGAPARRLGTVVGTTKASFPIRASDLQYGQYLRVEVHTIGTRESWMSEPMSVDGDVVAVLDVHTNPWGGCSQSTLHVVAISDSMRIARDWLRNGRPLPRPATGGGDRRHGERSRS